MSFRRSLITLAITLACAVPADAQFCNETTPNVQSGFPAQVGTAIDVEGGTMIVALGPTTNQTYLFRMSGGEWDLSAGVFSVMSGVSDVAISAGDFADAVAAIGFADASNGTLPGSSGLVEVVQPAAFPIPFASLEPPSTLGYPIEGFGTSVDIVGDGEWILVGAPATFGDAGCVFSYERTGPTTWTFRDDVFAGTTPDRFGTSIAVEGTRLIVGAPGTDTMSGADAGAVYFYDLDPSTGVMTLVGSDLGVSAGAALGSSVAIDTGSAGFVAAAGAPKNADFGVDGGSVTFYSGTTNVGTLSQSGGQQLGTSVAVTGDTVFGGRPGDNTVDRYEVSTGGVTFIEAFSGSGIVPGDRFGEALAAQGGEVFVGVPGDDTFGVDNGSVRVFGPGFTTTSLGNGLAGFAGLTPQLTASSGFCEGDDFTLTLSSAAPGAQAGLFIGFQASINAPFKGGTLVPSPDLLVILPTGFGTLPITSPWPAGVNIPLEFQYWIQDPAGPKGFSASNAIRVAP